MYAYTFSWSGTLLFFSLVYDLELSGGGIGDLVVVGTVVVVGKTLDVRLHVVFVCLSSLRSVDLDEDRDDGLQSVDCLGYPGVVDSVVLIGRRREHSHGDRGGVYVARPSRTYIEFTVIGELSGITVGRPSVHPVQSYKEAAGFGDVVDGPVGGPISTGSKSISRPFEEGCGGIIRGYVLIVFVFDSLSSNLVFFPFASRLEVHFVETRFGDGKHWFVGSAGYRRHIGVDSHQHDMQADSEESGQTTVEHQIEQENFCPALQ